MSSCRRVQKWSASQGGSDLLAAARREIRGEQKSSPIARIRPQICHEMHHNAEAGHDIGPDADAHNFTTFSKCVPFSFSLLWSPWPWPALFPRSPTRLSPWVSPRFLVSSCELELLVAAMWLLHSTASRVACLRCSAHCLNRERRLNQQFLVVRFVALPCSTRPCCVGSSESFQHPGYLGCLLDRQLRHHHQPGW